MKRIRHPPAGLRLGSCDAARGDCRPAQRAATRRPAPPPPGSLAQRAASSCSARAAPARTSGEGTAATSAGSAPGSATGTAGQLRAREPAGRLSPDGPSSIAMASSEVWASSSARTSCCRRARWRSFRTFRRVRRLRPGPGRGRCSRRPTWLEIDNFTDAAPLWWQINTCQSNGRDPETGGTDPNCIFLGRPDGAHDHPTTAILHGWPPSVLDTPFLHMSDLWSAPPGATEADAVGHMQITSCYFDTASCPEREQGTQDPGPFGDERERHRPFHRPDYYRARRDRGRPGLRSPATSPGPD